MPMQCYGSMVYATDLCLSVTSRYCTETAESIKLVLANRLPWLIGPILWGHSGPLSRVVVVDIYFKLPFTRCRYCRTPLRYSYVAGFGSSW